MVALGPYRFVAEHKMHKKNLVTPMKWLSLMARDMSNKSKILLSNGSAQLITGADVARDFNELIESGDIDQFITKSSISIAEDVAKEFLEDPKKFKETYKLNKGKNDEPV